MSTDKDQNQAPNNTDIITSSPKTKRGRKAGYRKPKNLTNGAITSDKIFSFVNRNTIPNNSLQTFLTICDTWINDLGADSLKDTDLEEIALYARDRIYIDGIFQTFAEAGTIDPNLISQIEKMNKGMESRKENLGARFKDRGDKRISKSSAGFMSLFEDFMDDPSTFSNKAAEVNQTVQDNKEKFSKLDDYMETYSSPTQMGVKEEDESS